MNISKNMTRDIDVEIIWIIAQCENALCEQAGLILSRKVMVSAEIGSTFRPFQGIPVGYSVIQFKGCGFHERLGKPY